MGAFGDFRDAMRRLAWMGPLSDREIQIAGLHLDSSLLWDLSEGDAAITLPTIQVRRRNNLGKLVSNTRSNCHFGAIAWFQDAREILAPVSPDSCSVDNKNVIFNRVRHYEEKVVLPWTIVEEKRCAELNGHQDIARRSEA